MLTKELIERWRIQCDGILSNGKQCTYWVDSDSASGAIRRALMEGMKCLGEIKWLCPLEHAGEKEGKNELATN